MVRRACPVRRQIKKPNPVRLHGVRSAFLWNHTARVTWADGADGKSAYQQAVDGGYTGTEAEFQAILATGPWLPLSGGYNNKMTGSLNANSNIIEGIYATLFSACSGIGFGGNAGIAFLGGKFFFGGPNNNEIELSNIASPTGDYNAANKQYVDGLVGDIASILDSINGEGV